MVKRILKILLLLLLVLVCFAGIYLYTVSHSNPHNYSHIGDIPVPAGFQRIDKGGFTSFLRDIKLKGAGTKVQLFTGGNANLQQLNYAVLDVPLISNWEQCADACIRLHAEYLYKSKQFAQIGYKDVNGRQMNYSGGNSRKSFETYLKKVYGMASTLSLSKYLSQVNTMDIMPGDVFVYPARGKAKYGHAVLVVDVAVNKSTGRRAFMLAEGNTPARDLHLLRNLKHPFSAPWFTVDGTESSFRLGPFLYFPNEIRRF